MPLIKYLTHQGGIIAQDQAVKIRKDKRDLELVKKCLDGLLTGQKNETNIYSNLQVTKKDQNQLNSMKTWHLKLLTKALKYTLNKELIVYLTSQNLANKI